MMQEETDYKRMFLAVGLAALLLVTWQALIELPRRQEMARQSIAYQEKKKQQRKADSAVVASRDQADYDPKLTREQRLERSPRLPIRSDQIDGSISLKGARFDDLKLVKYRVGIEEGSPEVTLFSPQGDPDSYFVQIGWLSSDSSVKLPGQQTLWQADATVLGSGKPVTLRWDNGEGLTFLITVALDDRYMFKIDQRVENHSGRDVAIMPYAYINRAYVEPKQHYAILHEGPLGVMEGSLSEIQYADLREKGKQQYDNATGWFGITDKYWLSALIPGEQHFTASLSHYQKQGADLYQADYLGAEETVAAGASGSHSLRLFAGAKEIEIIDRYAEGDPVTGAPPIPLFDRAVDFGSLYFLTKPMFLTLNFFYTHIGNFGLAIMLLTVLVKLLLYPLANKSYKAMARMRALQPEMTKLRERYGDDAIRMNQEMMALYKRERVNPASGCLPILIQMPVFFALYKVLFVSIEMRHAPFFGWIRDLSAADPANIFTLFGLFPWHHPAWMHLGVLPMLMTLTMVIQMRQQPTPPDPVQAKVIAWMPYFFLFIFASFPAGLVLYWVWSNILSIIQQQIISKRHGGKKKAAAKAAAS